MLNQLAILSCDNSGYTQKQHSSGKTRVLSPQKCQDGFKNDHKLPSHWAVVSPSSTTPTLYSGDVFQMHLFVLRDFNSLVKSKHYVRKKFGGSFLWPLQISFQEIKLHMIFLRQNSFSSSAEKLCTAVCSSLYLWITFLLAICEWDVNWHNKWDFPRLFRRLCKPVEDFLRLFKAFLTVQRMTSGFRHISTLSYPFF